MFKIENIEETLFLEALKNNLELSTERISRLKVRAKEIYNKIEEVFGKEYEEAPYNKNEDLPEAVKKYPSGAQDAFRFAFNSALKSYKNEATAFKVGWSALKRWVKKHQ